MLIPAPTSPSAVADSHTWMLVKPCLASERAQPIPPIPAPMLRRCQNSPWSVVEPVGHSTTHMWMFRSASGGAMVSELSLVFGEGGGVFSVEIRREDEKARCENVHLTTLASACSSKIYSGLSGRLGAAHTALSTDRSILRGRR
jgi:hypothetical protein